MSQSFAAPAKRGRPVGSRRPKTKAATVADFVTEALTNSPQPPPPAPRKPRDPNRKAGVWDTMTPEERSAYAKRLASLRRPENMRRNTSRKGVPHGWSGPAVAVATAAARLEAQELVNRLKATGTIAKGDTEGEQATLEALVIVRTPGSSQKRRKCALRLLRHYGTEPCRVPHLKAKAAHSTNQPPPLRPCGHRQERLNSIWNNSISNTDNASQPDIARIKRNISRMLNMGLPETEIDAYIREEGITLAELQAHRPSKGGQQTYEIEAPNGRTYQVEGPAGATDEEIRAEVLRQHPDAGGRTAPNRSARETYQVLSRLVTQLYPHARITSTKRSAEHNRAVGGVENSYHVSGHGLDVVGLSPAERADLKHQMEAAGVQLDEFKYHDAGSGMHLHIAATHVPEDLFDPEVSGVNAAPETGETVPTGYADEQSPAVGPAGYAPEASDEAGFFGMPTSWDQVAKGLEIGAGDVVEGIGDSLGLIANPINTLVGRGLGYDSYTADLGGSMRDALGLDRATTTAGRISSDVISGATGGLAFSGAANVAGKATGTLAQQALAKLGSTPIRDAVAGGTSALAADAAEAAGAGPIGQTAAALAGRAVGGLGIAKRGERALAPVADRLMPKLAQRAFERKQLENGLREMDRAVSGDLHKVVSGIKPGAKRLNKAEKAVLLERVSTLEASYLPHDDIKALKIAASKKAALRRALDNRHLLSQPEINAIADGTAEGQGVANAILKAQALRRHVPEVAGQHNAAAGRFLGEALGSSAGSSLGYAIGGGPAGGALGGILGSAAVRALKRSPAELAADKAVQLAAQASKFEAMPKAPWGDPNEPMEALSRAAAEALDEPLVAQAAAAKLAQDARNTMKANSLANVKPQGGFRGLIFEKVGLLPEQQDAGAMMALRDGAITPDQLNAFLEAPEKLMDGNAGNALLDRLASMADSGQLKRADDWTPPEAPPAATPSLDAQGQPIRSVEAYRAGVAKNIARQLQLEKELDEIDPIQTLFGDGGAVRTSEIPELAAKMTEAARTRAAAIRAELSRGRSAGEAK